jgi:hypothetical protein
MFVIPAKAGIQDNTGFRVKPGMTNYTDLMSSCIICVPPQFWVQNRTDRDAGENFRAATLVCPPAAGVH